MAMNMAGSSGGGGRRSRRKPVMAEINVTPMVDVMLVLLIIFMVSAPMLTVGVPLDLPQTQAKSLEQDKTPLQLSVDTRGKVFINDTEVAMNELIPETKGYYRRPRRHGRAYLYAGRQEGRLRNRGEDNGAIVRRGLQATCAGHRGGAGVLSG